jgi:protein-disulfide isomerase
MKISIVPKSFLLAYKIGHDDANNCRDRREIAATTSQYLFCRIVFMALLLFASATLSRTNVGAQDQPERNPSADEQRVIQKAKDEIMKELREGEFLRGRIQLGIEDYLNKQRDAQIAAQAEQARLRSEKLKNVRRVSALRDHILGNPNAPVSLIEYSDYECPFCKSFHPTAKDIVKAYEGKVNWVYRHFPLSFHNPGAQKQAEAAECVHELGGNEAFWKYSDAIYERTKSNGNGFPLTQLAPLAKELGLDEKRFAQCFESGKYERRVKEDFNEGGQIGITGTPTNILLNNQTGEVVLKTGAQPLDAFKPDITKMLDQK